MRPLRFIICIKLFKWYMLLLRANVPSVKRFVLQAITVLIFYLIFCLAYRSLFHYFLSILVWPGPFCWLYFIYYLVKFTLGVYYRSVRRLRLMMLEWFDWNVSCNIYLINWLTLFWCFCLMWKYYCRKRQGEANDTCALAVSFLIPRLPENENRS